MQASASLEPEPPVALDTVDVLCDHDAAGWTGWDLVQLDWSARADQRAAV